MASTYTSALGRTLGDKGVTLTETLTTARDRVIKETKGAQRPELINRLGAEVGSIMLNPDPDSLVRPLPPYDEQPDAMTQLIFQTNWNQQSQRSAGMRALRGFIEAGVHPAPHEGIYPQCNPSVPLIVRREMLEAASNVCSLSGMTIKLENWSWECVCLVL